MSSQYHQLRAKLAELFQLDAAAELDFGIYRILNARRVEIGRFLDGLQIEVEGIIKSLLDDKSSAAQTEAEKLRAQLEAAGVDPEQSPKFLKLKEEAALAGGSTFELENEIFSRLTTFFSRYYKDGDFLSLRRYKRDTYAIPYEGEEVKLHWANADQFYIKSAENFRDYTFRLGTAPKDGTPDTRPRVTFKLTEADTERDNNKAVAGKERRFIYQGIIASGIDAPKILNPKSEILNSAPSLVLGFEYRALNGEEEGTDGDEEAAADDTAAGKKKKKKKDQAALNREAVQRILAECARGPFAEIAAKRPTEKNKERTLLEKHLTDYTARNTFDYFIHKDLGAFLRRELDFYLKNEVLHLDDLEAAPEPGWRQQQARLKALRTIAHKVIRFLAQIEDFQKRLWLKKKFVTRCDYVITLDRLPAALLPEVAACAAQREEWVRLLALDEITADLGRTGYSVPVTVEFLKENAALPVDTRHFGEEFRRKVQAGIEDEAASLNGTVVQSDNAHALRLFQHGLGSKVQFSYIDPPYNTGGNDFCFKDGFQHSSWITMIRERLNLAYSLLAEKGVVYASIDANERTNLSLSFEWIFGVEHRVEEIVWVQNSTKNQSPTYSTNHEYILVFARDLAVCKKDFRMFREVKAGCAEIQELAAEINPSYPSSTEVEMAIRGLFKKRKALHSDDPEQDDWKGVYNYNHAEYRNPTSGRYVEDRDAENAKAVIWVWRESDPSMPQVKEDSQKESFRDPNDPTFRFYRPTHPITKRQCPHPKTGWRWPMSPHGRQTNCFTDLEADQRIVWGDDETKIPQTKRFLHEVETNVAKSVIQDFSDGEKELANLFGRSRVFSNPKPTTLVTRFILQGSDSQSMCLDFFPGSGTTGHAVINLNREDNGTRKYVLVEMGEHFDTVLVPRLKKVIYAKDWKEGKPASRNTGVSHCCKILRLESYEDTLNNLRLPARRPEAQELALAEATPAAREEYTLGYMLELETQGSPSLLNVTAFTDPWHYTLDVATGTAGETRPVAVDLVETFNWLLGLTVRHTDYLRGVCAVDGTNPGGERVLILWRHTAEVDAEALNEWFTKQGYSTRDLEYALIYVNGDHHLENLRRDDQTWKVRLIDEEFPRLMWEGCQ